MIMNKKVTRVNKESGESGPGDNDVDRVARDKVGRWDTIGSVKQCQVAAAC